MIVLVKGFGRASGKTTLATALRDLFEENAIRKFTVIDEYNDEYFFLVEDIYSRSAQCFPFRKVRESLTIPQLHNVYGDIIVTLKYNTDEYDHLATFIYTAWSKNTASIEETIRRLESKDAEEINRLSKKS